MSGFPVQKTDLKARQGKVQIYSKGLLLPMATVSLKTLFKASNGFKILKTIMLNADVAKLVQTPKPFTLFAPTDKAFERMSQSALKQLLSDSRAIVAMMKRHMAVDSIYTSFLDNKNSKFSTVSLSGKTLTLSKSSKGDDVNATIMINDVLMTSPYDVTTGNGVVHAVDKVLK